MESLPWEGIRDRFPAVRWLSAATLVALAACSGDEPAQTSVCEQLGTFHRTSRNNLERLRINDMVEPAEWKCLAEALADLDAALTKRCETTAVTLGEIKQEQRSGYSACLDPPRDAVLQKAVVRSLP